jgi:hypothetical protein
MGNYCKHSQCSKPAREKCTAALTVFAIIPHEAPTITNTIIALMKRNLFKVLSPTFHLPVRNAPLEEKYKGEKEHEIEKNVGTESDAAEVMKPKS